MDEYLNLIKRFNSKPNLCNWFQLVSYDTWRRIEFARNQWGLKIFETTITQNILYEFAVYKKLYSLPLTMYEAVNEQANGNDIEFEYILKGNQFNLPMQAKIIYGDGRYPRMEHGAQIESLIDYAERTQGFPLYLLYNYCPDAIQEDFPMTTECGVEYGLKQYGISAISAHHLHANYYNARIDRNGVRRWNIPHFNDIHPNPAFPWFKLVCCSHSFKSFENLLKLVDPDFQKRKTDFRLSKSKKIKKVDEEHWKKLELESKLGSKNQEKLIYESKRLTSFKDDLSVTESSEKENTKIEYNPKYKVIINLDSYD